MNNKKDIFTPESNGDKPDVSQAVRYNLENFLFDITLVSIEERMCEVAVFVEKMENLDFPEWLIADVLDNFFQTTDDEPVIQ